VKKFKQICLIPCSGFNILGESARRASGIVSEIEMSDVAETLDLVGVTKAFMTGHFNAASPIIKRMKKQKVITIEGCEYCCATGLIELMGIKPVEKIILRHFLALEEREDELSKITSVTEEDIRKSVDIIKRCIESVK